MGADSVRPIVRRQECVDRIWSQAAVGAVTVERWRRVGEALARSEKHDRHRENDLAQDQALARQKQGRETVY